MTTTKLIASGIALSLVAGLALAGCGDDKTTPDARTFDAHHLPDASGDATQNPAPPALGAQIDRMGRPAINTALNHTFDLSNTTKQQAKDAYNGEADPTMWATLQLTTAGDVTVTQFEANLGIIDSLDSDATNSGCSSARSDPAVEQPLYDGTASGAAAYQGLAGALADDELYVASNVGTCTTYLGVEGAAILQQGVNDCGGRAPTYDVMDISYTALAIGLGPIVGGGTLVTDGVDNDDAPAADDTTFPFLGAPH
jgi:hypothetical protein